MTVKRPSTEARSEITTAAARAIIDAEKRAEQAKTARLRAARLLRDAAQAEENAVPAPARGKTAKRAAKI